MTAFMNNISTNSNGGILKKAFILMMASPLLMSNTVQALPSLESSGVMKAEDMVDGRSELLGAENQVFEHLFKRQTDLENVEGVRLETVNEKRDLYEIELSEAEAELLGNLKKFVPDFKKLAPLLKTYIPLIQAHAPSVLNLSVRDAIVKLGLGKYLNVVGLGGGESSGGQDGAEGYSKRDLYEVELSEAEAELLGKLKKFVPDFKKLAPLLKSYAPLLRMYGPSVLNLTVKDAIVKLGFGKYLNVAGLGGGESSSGQESAEGYSGGELTKRGVSEEYPEKKEETVKNPKANFYSQFKKVIKLARPDKVLTRVILNSRIIDLLKVLNINLGHKSKTHHVDYEPKTTDTKPSYEAKPDNEPKKDDEKKAGSYGDAAPKSPYSATKVASKKA
ncbi:hypothetical protein K7432_002218 [Basidiobolus ranarum]|uniref:Uncharacterized protein n=1 Tax=Basidiobolus ranarum TaxID=34480 RepID=A0ABR2X1U2_9FUNG